MDHILEHWKGYIDQYCWRYHCTWQDWGGSRHKPQEPNGDSNIVRVGVQSHEDRSLRQTSSILWLHVRRIRYTPRPSQRSIYQQHGLSEICVYDRTPKSIYARSINPDSTPRAAKEGHTIQVERVFQENLSEAERGCSKRHNPVLFWSGEVTCASRSMHRRQDWMRPSCKQASQ